MCSANIHTVSICFNLFIVNIVNQYGSLGATGSLQPPVDCCQPHLCPARCRHLFTLAASSATLSDRKICRIARLQVALQNRPAARAHTSKAVDGRAWKPVPSTAHARRASKMAQSLVYGSSNILRQSSMQLPSGSSSPKTTDLSKNRILSVCTRERASKATYGVSRAQNWASHSDLGRANISWQRRVLKCRHDGIRNPDPVSQSPPLSDSPLADCTAIYMS